MESDFISFYDTLLQYYLHIADPSALSDEMWALKIKHLEIIRKAENGKL
jgi:hypothetical protein